jgi:hypothetical protein
VAALILSGLTAACSGSTGSAAPKRSLVPDWTKTISSICIDSSGQPYPGIDAGPMVAVVERLAGRIGIGVATTGDCDATLTVTLTFTPLDKYYVGIGGPGGNCYTGANVAGSLKLEAPGKTPVSIAVSGEKKPTSGTISTCPTAAKAPFGSVWPRALVVALGNLLGDEVADAAIVDSDPIIRAIGVGMLSGRPSSEVVPVLLGLLKDPDANVRAQVTYALGERRPDSTEVIDALIGALSDPSDLVRAGAAAALGAIGPAAARAAPEIVKLAASGDSGVRTVALGAIEEMGPAASAVVPQLIALLGDKDSQVRSAAADALGAIGPAASAAVPALTDLLDDSAFFVVDSAEGALAKITGVKPTGHMCTAPDVKGKTIAEARTLWQAAGFSSSVETTGSGDYRIRVQSPSAGEMLDCKTFIPLHVLP